MKYLAVIFGSLFLTTQLSYGQNDELPKLKVIIKQRVLPGPNPDIEYHIKKNRLKVYSINIWGNDWKSKQLLYFGFLEKSTIDSIKTLISDSQIKSLDEYYTGGYIDGVIWTFHFKSTTPSMKIVLDNYYIKELGVLLNIINAELPKNKRYIQFEYLNIKQKFEEGTSNH